MALTNAEKQARWREKKRAIAAANKETKAGLPKPKRSVKRTTTVEHLLDSGAPPLPTVSTGSVWANLEGGLPSRKARCKVKAVEYPAEKFKAGSM